jgi:hypothetical protein
MAAARVIAPKTSHSASASPPHEGCVTQKLADVDRQRAHPLASAQQERLSGVLRRGPEVALLLLISG